VYGEGGQTCGIIGIRDTVRCIQLACENPVNRGEFRAFNQMPQSMSVAQIAETVQAAFPGTSPSRAWTTLSADPNRTRVIRPYGECHLGPE
jgi:nucleoside-diphosphate-sugar epimerase